MTTDIEALRGLLEHRDALGPNDYQMDHIYSAEIADQLPALLDELEAVWAENARMREAIELALCCTPSIRSTPSQFHGHGDIRTIVYDCGDPWEILRAALTPKDAQP